MSVAERVHKVIVEQLGIEPARVTDDATIYGDGKGNLGADSLDTVEIAMGMEGEFNIEVPDKDMDGLKTVRDIIEYVTRKQ